MGSPCANLRGMNQLQAYLDASGVKPSELAAKVGTSRGYISDLANGKRARPGLTVAAAIERATDGAVPASGWVAPCEHSADHAPVNLVLSGRSDGAA